MFSRQLRLIGLDQITNVERRLGVSAATCPLVAASVYATVWAFARYLVVKTRT